MSTFDYDLFNENGYVLIKNAIAPSLLAQKEIKAIVQKSKKGELISSQSFAHYPKFIDGINVGQINYPWQECSPMMPNIKQSIESIDFDSLFKSFLNLEYSSYFMSCFRMHVTSKYFKYSQKWHRDISGENTPLEIFSDNKPKSLRMNLYFFDEIGFQIIPKSHKPMYIDRIKEKEIWAEGLITKTNLKIAKTIHASAGDILIFHPDLLHRGNCAHERASFHVAFDLDDEVESKQDSNLPNNIKYRTKRPLEASDGGQPYTALRVFINLCRYYLPIPSRNYFRFLIKKPIYLDNTFIQRHSIFNKTKYPNK